MLLYVIGLPRDEFWPGTGTVCILGDVTLSVTALELSRPHFKGATAVFTPRYNHSEQCSVTPSSIALAMMGFPLGGRYLSSRVIQKETRLLVFDFFKTTEEENLLSVIAERLKKASHTKKNMEVCST